MDEKTHFINIDLDLESSEPLDILIEEMKGIFLLLSYDKRPNGKYFAMFEVNDSFDTLAECLNIFFNGINSLSEKSKSEWNKVPKKEFNIGFQSGTKPLGFVSVITKNDVRKISELDASVAITVYSPDNNSINS